MKSFIMVAKEPGHKDEFDQNAPGSQEDVPGKPGVKNPDTGSSHTTSG